MSDELREIADADDLRTAARVLKWDAREWPDLAARLEAFADLIDRDQVHVIIPLTRPDPQTLEADR